MNKNPTTKETVELPKGSEGCELLVLSGSRMYGYSTPESDYDYRGFSMDCQRCLLGLEDSKTYSPSEGDITYWGWRKFHNMLIVGNPNVLELLYAPTENIIKLSVIGKTLIENRSLYLSRKFVQAVGGYSQSEWKRGTGCIVCLNDDLSMKEPLDIKYKSVSHSIRTLEQATELLSTGEMTFPRPNASLLGEIRAGSLSFREILDLYKEADRLFVEAKDSEAVVDLSVEDKMRLDDFYYEMIKDEMFHFCNSEYDWMRD